MRHNGGDPWERVGQSALTVASYDNDAAANELSLDIPPPRVRGGGRTPGRTPNRTPGRTPLNTGRSRGTPSSTRKRRETVRNPLEVLKILGALRTAKTVGAREHGCHALVSELELNASGKGGKYALAVAGVLLQNDAIAVVLECMGRHPRNAWIQRSGCVVLKAVLLALTRDETLRAMHEVANDSEAAEGEAEAELTRIKLGVALLERLLRPDADGDGEADDEHDHTQLRVLKPGMAHPGVLDAVTFAMMFHSAEYGVQWAGCDVIAAIANVAADLDLRLLRAQRAAQRAGGVAFSEALSAALKAKEATSGAEEAKVHVHDDDADSLASSRPQTAVVPPPATLHEQVAACIAQVVAVDLDGDGQYGAEEVNTIAHALSNGLTAHAQYLCVVFAACAAVNAVLTIPRLASPPLTVEDEVAQRTGRSRATKAAFAPPFGGLKEKCQRYAVPVALEATRPHKRAGWAFDVSDMRGSLAHAAAAHVGHSGIVAACESAVGLVTAASTVVQPKEMSFMVDGAVGAKSKSSLVGHAETKRARRTVMRMQSAMDDTDALGEGCYAIATILNELEVEGPAAAMVLAALFKLMLPALLVRMSAQYMEEEDLQTTIAALISTLIRYAPDRGTNALVDADCLSQLEKVVAAHPDEPTVQHRVGSVMQELDDAADLLSAALASRRLGGVAEHLESDTYSKP